MSEKNQLPVNTSEKPSSLEAEQVPKFVVDAIAYKGDTDEQMKELIFKKTFNTFDDLKALLNKNGYQTGAPEVVEGHQDNLAHIRVYQDEKHRATLTVAANISLQGSNILNKPE